MNDNVSALATLFAHYPETFMDLYRQSVGGPPSKVAIKERDQDCPIPSRRSDNHMPQTQINNRQKKNLCRLEIFLKWLSIDIICISKGHVKKADFFQYSGTVKVQLLQTILKCFVHKVAQPFCLLVAFRRQLLALA